ncbi:MAG: hypothetical protein AAF456_10245 [Planctomycetota bacterium]
MEDFIPFFVIGGILIAVAAAIYFAWLYEKKRKEALGGLADQMGLEYKPDGDANVHSAMSVFSLFNSGRRRKLTNLILGTTDEVSIAIFDYQYTTGSGKHQHTHKQTVAALSSQVLHCPQFFMRPEGMFDKIGSALGFQDIDFDSHPTFSKMFVLKGNDEGAIRQFFAPPVLEFFEQRKGISVEAIPGRLVFYRPNKRVKPDEIKDLLSQAYEVFGIMADPKKV